jgi:beta-N-acetylhexosaminidase
LSRPVITGVLRGELGFRGVVVTDELNMKALSGLGGPGALARRALEAGADLVLIGQYKDAQVEAQRVVLDAFKKGELPQAGLDESVARILALKLKYVSWTDPFTNPRYIARRVGTPEQKALSLALRRSVGGLPRAGKRGGATENGRGRR